MQKLSKNRRHAVMGILAVAITGIVFSSILLINNPFNPRTAPGDTLETEPGEKPLLTEFGDFQCPHCANFALNILPALEQDLIETGTIRFEYRHYPFLGPESVSAAEASECARDQGRFNEYHLELYRLNSKREELHAGTAAGNRCRDGSGPNRIRPVPPVGREAGPGHGGPGVWENSGSSRDPHPVHQRQNDSLE